jgi:hypothetical protein
VYSLTLDATVLGSTRRRRFLVKKRAKDDRLISLDIHNETRKEIVAVVEQEDRFPNGKSHHKRKEKHTTTIELIAAHSN